MAPPSPSSLTGSHSPSPSNSWLVYTVYLSIFLSPLPRLVSHSFTCLPCSLSFSHSPPPLSPPCIVSYGEERFEGWGPPIMVQPGDITYGWPIAANLGATMHKMMKWEKLLSPIRSSRRFQPMFQPIRMVPSDVTPLVTSQLACRVRAHFPIK